MSVQRHLSASDRRSWTPAVRRAADELERREHEVEFYDVIAHAAIKAFWDDEEVARALFVSDSEQPLAFALRIWDEARDDSPVKRLFRTHAMKIRTLLLGDS